jgi:phenylacetate-CoA ligase
VPFYKKIFSDYGFRPNQIQQVSDLTKLPTLTKQDIIKNYDALISDEYRSKKLRTEMTSGSTGTPLRVHMNDEVYLYSKAIEVLQRNWAGVKPDDWIGSFTGYLLIPAKQNRPPYWVNNYHRRQIHFSTYHLGTETSRLYLEKIEQSKIAYLVGYASALALLAQEALKHNKRIELKGVIYGSEPLLDWQAEAIRNAFNCKIFGHYGQAERVFHAISCGASANLHLIPSFCIAEFRPLGNTNSKSLIATSLLNSAFPLIRYETNDITSPIAQSCSCGRSFGLLSPIETRCEDYVVTPKGRYVSPPAFTLAIRSVAGIEKSQIIQTDRQRLNIKIVRNELYNQKSANQIIRDMKKIVGKEMNVSIEIVDDIPRQKNGKYRFVISDISKYL